MTINARARTHYDNACEWLDDAADCAARGEINLAVVNTGLAAAATDLARFAAENHALVAGIDEDVPDVRQPMSGAKVWGPPPPNLGMRP
jgi:phage gp36-like protein